MKTMTTRTMQPVRRRSVAVKIQMVKKDRMTPNHNVHVISPHGKVVLGRKGRTS